MWKGRDQGAWRAVAALHAHFFCHQNESGIFAKTRQKSLGLYCIFVTVLLTIESIQTGDMFHP
ncbi:hypothetical protein, partial [Intestinimonas timonensis]|uniref:hypothetical protein n=1 Tax=Intestinimonas timonensis TaxID=1689270 RepID=UPI003A95BEC0